MIPDSLFFPPQSPVFFLLRVPFLLSPSPVSSSSEYRFHPTSKSLFRPGQSPVFLPPQSPHRPLPSSSSSFFLSKFSHILSDSRFSPLQVLSHPLRPLPLLLQAKENSGTTRSRPAVLGWCGWWFVQKWNMTSSYLFMLMVTSVGSSSSHFTSGKHFLSISK